MQVSTCCDIKLPASTELAERLIYVGLMQGREVILNAAQGVELCEDTIKFADRMGYRITGIDDRIEMTASETHQANGDPVPVADKRDFFRKMLVIARSGLVARLATPTNVDADFESELILYKRMGFDYEVVNSNRTTLCKPSLTETGQMKYRLPAKNYHLVESLVSGTSSSKCSVELVSPVEIHPMMDVSLPDIGIDMMLQKDEQEGDELARRLKRLRPARKKEFKYTIVRGDTDSRLQLSLPGDRSLGLFLIGVGCLQSASDFKVSGFAKSDAVSAFCRMLTKIGVGISVNDVATATGEKACAISLSVGELTGKKIGGSDIRSCPEVFAVLASLGMFAEGKTVIRDLPFGSGLWRNRVGFVRDMLESCGARVGEVEDGLVVEKGTDLMMMSCIDTSDAYLDLFQQMLSLALPHHSSYHEPPHFQNSQFMNLYNGSTN